MRLVLPSTDTVPAAVNRYLLPHERQVISLRFHPAILLRPIGVTVAGLIAIWVLTSVSNFSSIATLIIWLVWGLLLLYSLGKVLSWSVDYLVLTSQRVLVIKGILTRDVAMLPLVMATRMRLRRTTTGRLLGYGRFTFEAVGQDQAMRSINFIPYPEQVYLEVCGLIYRDKEEDPDQWREQRSAIPSSDPDEVPPRWPGLPDL